MEIALAIVAVAAVCGLAYVILKAMEKARQEYLARLRDFASQLGLTYVEEIPLFSGGWLSKEPEPFMAHFGDLPPFPGETNPTFRDVLCGSAYGFGWHFGTFTYQRISHNGKTTTTTTFTFGVCAVTLPYTVPRFEIRGEHFFDKVGALLGDRDIEFEMDEFNRRFHVKCEDRKFAFDVLHPQAMEWFLENDVYPISMTRNSLVMASTGRGEPPEFERMITCVREFLGQMPDFVRQDLTGR